MSFTFLFIVGIIVAVIYIGFSWKLKLEGTFSTRDFQKSLEFILSILLITLILEMFVGMSIKEALADYVLHLSLLMIVIMIVVLKIIHDKGHLKRAKNVLEPIIRNKGYQMELLKLKIIKKSLNSITVLVVLKFNDNYLKKSDEDIQQEIIDLIETLHENIELEETELKLIEFVRNNRKKKVKCELLVQEARS